MPQPLIPAQLARLADGTPYSVAYADVYHSGEGGPAQAQHVFIGGNGLPGRWRGREHFTILETGFGFGLNFLATWAAWKADPVRCGRLHFVSIEKHPFAREDLEKLHSPHPQFDTLSSEMRASWPMLVPGMHRLEFEGGRVVLTLCLADIATALPQLRMASDAFYLDGFSPASNPDMWSPPTLKTLSKLAAEGATFATYTAASSVRDAMAAAGFAVEKCPGFARKRDMLRGRFARIVAQRPSPERRALIIGAGLAGSAVVERLAARGWEVTLIERHGAPAMEASGNHAGAIHPLVTKDDSILAQLSRAAFLYSLRHWKGLEHLSWSQCGVLQMPRNVEEEASQRAALELLAYPAAYATRLSVEEASSRAGVSLAAGGLWFERAGWVQPGSLVRALLAKAGGRTLFNTVVAALSHSESGWAATDHRGRLVAEAPVVVLANAGEAMCLAPVPEVELRRVRGQVTYLPAEKLPPFSSVLLRGGMAIPPVDGIATAGASFDIDDTDSAPRADGHAGNLERLARILPGAGSGLDPLTLDGRVGFRAVARDRLPLVGALKEAEGLHGAFAYGSRGILWCSLMAELLASQLEGEPLPVEARLADAVAPGRFRLRAGRRKKDRSPPGAR
ncbi:MAG: bifunctional tRNA (5-methylaminomethyl-2-thiouridine)(34)-methyltransferase MnmD/FAD-dependent 5-carboxymethylaminomethyl-2-thiouridine(34) oxidoreductase MnmC [Betaproteobacteria bacterium]